MSTCVASHCHSRDVTTKHLLSDATGQLLWSVCCRMQLFRLWLERVDRAGYSYFVVWIEGLGSLLVLPFSDVPWENFFSDCIQMPKIVEIDTTDSYWIWLVEGWRALSRRDGLRWKCAKQMGGYRGMKWSMLIYFWLLDSSCSIAFFSCLVVQKSPLSRQYL